MKRALLYILLTCSSLAQSKLYIAEVAGSSSITADGVVTDGAHNSTYTATGTVVRTDNKSHIGLVLSNGSSMFAGDNTTLTVKKFEQERFDNQTPEVEPSKSTTQIEITQGQVVVCTGKLVTGSQMHYKSPHGLVNTRGGKFAVEVNDSVTTAYLLEGFASVTINGAAFSVQLQTDEYIIFGTDIMLGKIKSEKRNELNDKISVACNYRNQVLFEAAGAAGSDQTITANPVVKDTNSLNIVISPDKLEGKL